MTADMQSLWDVLAPISGGTNTLLFMVFGSLAILYSNVRETSERIVSLDRARREAELAEKKYRSLFENAGDSIFLIDPQTQSILDVNSKAAKHTGYSREELLQMRVLDLHPKEELEKVGIAFKEVLEEGLKERIEGFHHMRKDGSLIPISVTAAMLEVGDRLFNLSIIRDISAQKKAEGELQKKIDELEKWQGLTVGREIKMIELKKRIEELEESLGSK